MFFFRERKSVHNAGMILLMDPNHLFRFQYSSVKIQFIEIDPGLQSGAAKVKLLSVCFTELIHGHGLLKIQFPQIR